MNALYLDADDRWWTSSKIGQLAAKTVPKPCDWSVLTVRGRHMAGHRPQLELFSLSFFPELPLRTAYGLSKVGKLAAKTVPKPI